ncbi:quinone oxidoreductase family protein [Microbacterium thalli]|uniref:NADP-dependent oxidoreductase n=1 Tax=Microbacterium thalli TaxID=3027921 RepID=A0ABT5SKQ4_9MICO|nr:NADP-dependent oxidoreductase [Microbacterium thalli]MDD7963418.1 NADP-dependent oxidoreductase [Microbacterium thalli]MDN8548434.1 NADP-dependent oxidoreductase [Microbacterium thalli]
MAQAVTYSEFGGPEVLALHDIDVPEPAPGEVRLSVTAVGVNPIDHKLRAGLRPSATITKPRRMGNDGAGIVTQVGADVDGFRVGDEVVIFGARGVYATDIIATPDMLVPLPAGVSPAVGAALGIPVATAYQALRSLGVGPADTLLVHGGSGSVGQAAIQFARLRGAAVVATASEGRADRVRDLGGTPVVYGDGVAERVRSVAPQGVTVALDCAGTDEALSSSIELVADRSRIATIVRGADAAGLGIRAFSGGSPDPLTAQQLAWRAEAIPVVTALLAAGAFRVELGPELPLAAAAEAHRLVAAHTPGKIVLIP